MENIRRNVCRMSKKCPGIVRKLCEKYMINVRKNYEKYKNILWRNIQKYLKNVQKMSVKCVKNLRKICEKYLKIVRKIFEKFVGNVWKINENIWKLCEKNPKYVKGMSGKFAKKNVPKMYENFPKNFQKNCKKCLKHIWKLCEKISEEYSKNIQKMSETCGEYLILKRKKRKEYWVCLNIIISHNRKVLVGFRPAAFSVCSSAQTLESKNIRSGEEENSKLFIKCVCLFLRCDRTEERGPRSQTDLKTKTVRLLVAYKCV